MTELNRIQLAAQFVAARIAAGASLELAMKFGDEAALEFCAWARGKDGAPPEVVKLHDEIARLRAELSRRDEQDSLRTSYPFISADRDAWMKAAQGHYADLERYRAENIALTKSLDEMHVQHGKDVHEIQELDRANTALRVMNDEQKRETTFLRRQRDQAEREKREIECEYDAIRGLTRPSYVKITKRRKDQVDWSPFAEVSAAPRSGRSDWDAAQRLADALDAADGQFFYRVERAK